MYRKLMLKIIFLLFCINAYSLDSFILMIAAEDSIYSEKSSAYYINADIKISFTKNTQKYNYIPEKLTAGPVNPHEINSAFFKFDNIPTDTLITVISISDSYKSYSERFFVSSEIHKAFDDKLEVFFNKTSNFSTSGSLYYDTNGLPWYKCVVEYEYSADNVVINQYDYTRIPVSNSNDFYDLVIITNSLELENTESSVGNEDKSNSVYNALILDNLINNLEKNVSFSDYLKENIVLYGIIIAVIVGIASSLLSGLIIFNLKNKSKKTGKKDKKEEKAKHSKINYIRRKWTIQDLIDIDRKGGAFY